MPKLTFVVDDEPEVVVPLEGLVTLGRDEDNDVVIDDERISRHHAVLACYDDGRVEIRDMASTAGTSINGQPIRNHFYTEGELLAFGPLIARISLDASSSPAENAVETKYSSLNESIEKLTVKHADLTTSVHEIEATRSALQQEIQSLLDQQVIERSRVQELSQDSEQKELRLKDLNCLLIEMEERTTSVRAKADKNDSEAQLADSKLAQLQHDHQLAEETLNRVRAEVLSTENQRFELLTAVQQVQAQLSAHQISLEKANSEEISSRSLIAELSAREGKLRNSIEDLSSAIEKSRVELREVESRLTPLRDWMASMDQRYERLGAMTKDSAEEYELWREIEVSQAALFDLLPAARILAPRLTRGDFPRISKGAGVPLKSERIRRSG